MTDNATMPIRQSATHKPLVVGSNPIAATFFMLNFLHRTVY